MLSRKDDFYLPSSARESHHSPPDASNCAVPPSPATAPSQDSRGRLPNNPTSQSSRPPRCSSLRCLELVCRPPLGTFHLRPKRRLADDRVSACRTSERYRSAKLVCARCGDATQSRGTINGYSRTCASVAVKRTHWCAENPT